MADCADDIKKTWTPDNELTQVQFGQMVDEKSLSFQAVFFNNKLWYEIDTIEDLASAERMFFLKIPFQGIIAHRLNRTGLSTPKTTLKESIHAAS